METATYFFLGLLALVFIVGMGAFLGWVLMLILQALHVSLPFWASWTIGSLLLIAVSRG